MARWLVSEQRGIGARGHCAPPPTDSPASPASWSPPLFALDRLLWIWLYRVWPRCLNIVVLVKPTTVVQWHRQGFRLYWRWRSRPGRPLIDREVRDLIRQMNRANPLWGAPRIHGELLKQTSHGRKVHGATNRNALTDMAKLPAQRSIRRRRHRHVRRGVSLVSTALRHGHRASWSQRLCGSMLRGILRQHGPMENCFSVCCESTAPSFCCATATPPTENSVPLGVTAPYDGVLSEFTEESFMATFNGLTRGAPRNLLAVPKPRTIARCVIIDPACLSG